MNVHRKKGHVSADTRSGSCKCSGLQAVSIRQKCVSIPTYPVPPPDRNPLFLDKRVYQGSSGKVYPNAFIDRVADTKSDHQYRGIELENEYVRLLILPEIGGRIHVGQDRTNGYDFFYRQNVIKPALVGLLGPWISGGVEFNWPQHHRPSTFMPVDYEVEEGADGSRTVWLSEHEPMGRMKGMIGICLHPGKSLVEAKVRLYNRTPFPQTFLWWANAGIRVHDQYQAFFPPDVHFVADHAKRAMSSYPIARNFYYGVDYSQGVDISWYRNIPVPTSYMVTESRFGFLGGYDHRKQAGIVHYANPWIAPGKKLWTWGNAEFGWAWDRELTDADGPYIELMAGVYTDNQPDFSWLHPYETRTFSQFWYPIQKIGPVKNANKVLAVNLERIDHAWQVGVAATELIEGANVCLLADGSIVMDRRVDLSPSMPFLEMVPVEALGSATDLLLRVIDRAGRELIRYAPLPAKSVEIPAPATEPPTPTDTATCEELYLTGLHLQQYRHTTRLPEPYWNEAVARDAGDARSNNALGLAAMSRGEFQTAELHFRTAIRTLTFRNPNPRDGEPFYNLGLALSFQGRYDDAYAAFYKAVWNYAWQSPGYFALAQIDCRRGDFAQALEHLERSLSTNTGHSKARAIQAAILRRLNRRTEALAVVHEALSLDLLDLLSANERVLLGEGTSEQFFSRMSRCADSVLDLVFDYADAGLWSEAEELAARCPASHPMLQYAQAFCASQRGEIERATELYRKAGMASPDYCFPSRLEELVVLNDAIAVLPHARAHYYLGNLLYDKGRREEAIGHWEEAARLDPAYPVPWRNLGIAFFNVRKDPERATACYQRACQADPSDARYLFEIDQLRKRTRVSPEDRLAELERHRQLVESRDDLVTELVALYILTHRPDDALRILQNRRFHPWEGGEGLVSAQYVAAHLTLGRDALGRGEFAAALDHFSPARTYPDNLGEGKHLLTPENHIDYFTGLACSRLGRMEAARQAWQKAAGPGALDVFAYYRALGLRNLGKEPEAVELLERLQRYAGERRRADVKVDYFATSLPNFLIFDDDPAIRNEIESLRLGSLAQLGLGMTEAAVTGLQRVVEMEPSDFFAKFELDNHRLGIA